MADNRIPLRESNPAQYARLEAARQIIKDRRATEAAEAEAREMAYLSQYVRDHLLTDHPDNAVEFSGKYDEFKAYLNARPGLLVDDAEKLKAGTLVFDPEIWDSQDDFQSWVEQVKEYSAKQPG